MEYSFKILFLTLLRHFKYSSEETQFVVNGSGSVWVSLDSHRHECEPPHHFWTTSSVFLTTFYGCSSAPGCWSRISHTSHRKPFHGRSLSILWTVTEAFNIRCVLKHIWIEETVKLYFTDRSDTKLLSGLDLNKAIGKLYKVNRLDWTWGLSSVWRTLLFSLLKSLQLQSMSVSQHISWTALAQHLGGQKGYVYRLVKRCLFLTGSDNECSFRRPSRGRDERF